MVWGDRQQSTKSDNRKMAAGTAMAMVTTTTKLRTTMAAMETVVAVAFLTDRQQLM
jgi:hypothetical protein